MKLNYIMKFTSMVLEVFADRETLNGSATWDRKTIGRVHEDICQ